MSDGVVVTGSVIIAGRTIGLKEFVGRHGSYLAILADDPEEFERLAELALSAAKQMRAQEHRDLLFAAITGKAPASTASSPVPQAVTGTVADPSSAAAPVARTAPDLLAALQDSFDRAQRYGQCDSTCTVDCGHCKGAGAPAVPVARGGEACARSSCGHQPHHHIGGGIGHCLHASPECFCPEYLPADGAS